MGMSRTGVRRTRSAAARRATGVRRVRSLSSRASRRAARAPVGEQCGGTGMVDDEDRGEEKAGEGEEDCGDKN